MPTSDTPDDADPDKLVPIGEFARACGVHVTTVRNWERRGKVSSRRTPGGRRRFRLGDAAKFTA